MINGTNNNSDYSNNGDLGSQDPLNTDGSFDFGTDNTSVSNQDNRNVTSDLTRDEWKQLLTKVKTEKPSNEKDLLDIIKDAMWADLKHDQNTESEDISKLGDALGKDPLTYLNGSDTNNSDGATKVDADGTRHFIATQDNTDFSLTASGKKSKNIVDTAGNVTLTPSSPDEKITVSSEGKYNVFKFSNGDVYKVDKRAAVYVASENVTGDIENTNGKVTYGVSKQQSLISSQKLSDISNTIGSSASLIGSVTYGLDGDAHLQIINASKYSVGYKAGADIDTLSQTCSEEILSNDMKQTYVDAMNNGVGAQASGSANAVKDELGKIQAAINEKDPTKQSTLWSSINDDIKRWSSDDGLNGGVGNDRAQLLFNVLHGELGEEKFKWALQNGILPSDFTSAMNSSLTAVSGENTDRKEIDNYQTGGPAWTHQSSADFLNKYSGSSRDNSASSAQ